MCYIHFTAISILFIIGSCAGQKHEVKTGRLVGVIGIYEGNCMPGPGIEPCEPKPIATSILITALSENYNPKKMIMKLASDSEGNYGATLPEGAYSLFLQDEDKVVCAVIECPSTCFCQPFKITADSTTVIDSNLDHAIW